MMDLHSNLIIDGYEIMNDEPKAVETTEAPVAEEVAPVVEPVQQ